MTDSTHLTLYSPLDFEEGVEAELLTEFTNLWTPIMDDIVLMKPTPNGQWQLCQDSSFAYGCWADTIQRKPNFAGYLLARYDIIINYWNLPKQSDKLWISWRRILSPIRCPLLGMDPNLVATQLKKMLEATPDKLRQEIVQSLGPDWSNCVDSVDLEMFYYVPHQYRDRFVYFAKFFAEHKIEASVALSMISSLLSNKAATEWATKFHKMTYIKNTSPTQLRYDPSLVWFGPIDLLDPSDHALIRRMMNSAYAVRRAKPSQDGGYLDGIHK